jgi:hypothetical protein
MRCPSINQITKFPNNQILYALVTLPLRRQEVQTRIFLVAAPTLARTGRRLTFQRRLVTLWAWLMLLPNRGPLPQTSQT